MAEEAVALGL